MSVIKIHAPAYWREKRLASKKKTNHLETLIAYAHSEVKSESRLFKVSIIAEFVLFLPLIILLIFSFHTPLSMLVAVIALFFANFITGINGPAIRMVTSIFVLGLLNLLMLAILFV